MKAKKYRREILLKAHRYAKYQQDFLGVVLCKSEYTIAEADKAVLDNRFGCGHLGIGGLHIVGRHERNVHAAADVDAETDVRCALDVDILGVAVGIAHTKDGRQGEQHDQNCHDEQRP